MTKIDIISGFLGAGKTTLIKKLLSDAYKGEQVVLIENEFGEIGIDGGFLKEAGIEIREMNSGCICCSLVGDFGKSLHEVVDTYHPDRILIEPSGVGKLSDVIKAVQDVQGEIDAELNSFTTVVDVTKCKIYRKNFGEFFSNQIEYAGAVILSRTDKAKPEKIQESVALLRELNEKAPIITTPIEQLPGEKILETMESSKSLEDELLAEVAKEAHDHEHHHHHDGESTLYYDEEDMHDADEVFNSIGIETAHPFTKEELDDKLKILGTDESLGHILRSKGIVKGTDGKWFEFDFVSGDYEIRECTPDVGGRMCVIGEKLDAHKIYDLMKG